MAVSLLIVGEAGGHTYPRPIYKKEKIIVRVESVTTSGSHGFPKLAK